MLNNDLYTYIPNEIFDIPHDTTINDDGEIKPYRLKADIRVIYINLCSRVNEKGYATVTLKELCENIGMSRKTLIKYLKEAEFLGLIKKENVYDENRGRKANRYYVIHPKDSKLKDSKSLEKNYDEDVTEETEYYIVNDIRDSRLVIK